MKLSASIIKITWDFSRIREINDEGLVLYEIKDIEEIKDEKKGVNLGKEKDGEDWVTYSHYRIDGNENSIMHVGFKVHHSYNDFEDQGNNLMVEVFNKHDEEVQGNLLYDKKSGFWYEPIYFFASEEEDIHIPNESRFVPAGIKAAGHYWIKVKDNNSDEVHISPRIDVIPSAISVEDYEEIIRELLIIRDDLVLDNNSKVSLNTRGEFLIKDIKSYIKKLKLYLERINDNPRCKLKKDYIKSNSNNLKKISVKTLREISVNPHGRKYSVPEYTEDYNIYENQAIKYSIYKLKRKIEFYKFHYTKLEEIIYGENNKKIEEVSKGTKDLEIENNNIPRYGLSEEKERYHKAIINKKHTIEIGYKKASYLRKEFQKAHDDLEKLLNIDFLKNTMLKKVKLKSTQVFANDKNYFAVWRMLNTLKETYLTYDREGVNQLKTKDIQRLYEHWCLFKMIYLLINIQGWRLNECNSVIKALNEYLKSGGSKEIKRFSINLEHDVRQYNTKKKKDDNITDSNTSKGKVQLKIHYNRSFLNNDGKVRNPDYTFQFIKNDKVYYVYLDAKYRNYKEQTYRQWIKDIKEIAFEKYYKEFMYTDHKAYASFIIHNCGEDERLTNYGAYPIRGIDTHIMPNHSYGAISLMPSKSSDFLKLIKMIMEYHLEEYWTCWNCGESYSIIIEKKKTNGGFYKYYCTCKKCGEFWVKTHCDNKGKHHIVKHLDNYHRTKGTEPWYVYCPNGCK